MLEPLDVNRETLVQLAEVCKRFGIDKSTVWRWIKYGNNGVMLAARRIGGRWYTSEEAFQRFCDQVTAASLGEQSTSTFVAEPQPATTTYSPSRRPKRREEEIREVERQLRMMGMDGDERIFDRSSINKETLCDLHEYLEQWMPGSERYPDGVYKAVRSGLFARAVSMLEGKDGPKKSYKAVIAWIEQIDLLTFDIRTLPGIGPGYGSSWKELLADPKFAAKVKRSAG